MNFFSFLLFGVLAVLLVNGQDGDAGPGANLAEIYGDDIPDKAKPGVALEQQLLDMALGQLGGAPGGGEVANIVNDALENGGKVSKSKAQEEAAELKKEFDGQTIFAEV